MKDRSIGTMEEKQTMEDLGPTTERIAGAGGYPLAVRLWQASEPRATLVMLHGVVSHAGWLDPIASRLVRDGISVACLDRRGSGANTTARGDASGPADLLDDLQTVLAHYSRPECPVDLCGFCWGATYAVNYLSAREHGVRSLVLLAPGIFPAGELLRTPLVTGESGEATLEPTIPLDAFTRGPEYEGFILPDPLRLRRVSPRLNAVIRSLSRFVGVKLTRLTLPTLIVLPELDRITDNGATEKAFDRMRATPKRLVRVPGEHGVQFDAPRQAADAIVNWVTEVEATGIPTPKAPRRLA